ncbi:hypothetical protein KY309_02125 [Candidatus Woesearchaeota archaeon]|nr:hypothetical protein [Candidatus Woesearchaeota archaeon]
MKKVQKYAPWLLLIGGIVHLVPKLYTWLANLTGGTPWIQIIVGALSVIVALLSFKK